MFIGHNAVGFASKKLAPSTSLLLLMGAPMLLDLLWPIFLLLGIEHARIQPGATRLAPLALSMWILPLSAGWFDRHRDVVAT
jgi:hypothetical protein